MKKQKQQISFIICSPYHDNGLKSLGPKCLYHTKRQKLIEKQYKSIDKACDSQNYEIILVNSIDHNKTHRFIQNSENQINYQYLEHKNINYAGSLLTGLTLAKYDLICSIECGLVFSSDTIIRLLNQYNSDIGYGCINHKHKQHQDIDLGCSTNNNNEITNIFFGLEHKYSGISMFNNQVSNFILENFNMQNDSNKYMFEIYNRCISHGFTCKPVLLKTKDAHLIFNKKSLQQYTGAK